MKLVYDKFILQLEHPDEEEDEVPEKSPEKASSSKSKEEDVEDSADENSWEDDDSDSNGDTLPSSKKHRRKSSADTALTSPDADSDAEEGDGDDLIPPPHDEIIANKRAHPKLNRLFRSKGMFWLATRPDYSGEWSQAGTMLALLSNRQWFATLTEEELNEFCEDSELRKQLDHDIGKGPWGDRRQEIVFIGEKLDQTAIEALLDNCLLNDDEWAAWETAMRVVQKKQRQLFKIQYELETAKDKLTWELLDGFPEWEAHYLDEQPDEDHEGHHH